MVRWKVENEPSRHDGLTGEPDFVLGVDATPQINYDSQGIALAVKSFYVCNGVLGSIIYSFDTQNSSYFQDVDDPEHGPWSGSTSLSRLAEVDKLNPHAIQISKILGKEQSHVEKILENHEHSAYHFLSKA